ncbi:uncharacterized protein CCR75_007732 [Bremia lactucae]|uniref:Uncharacterized protein n=1 Tax=Bremia lactucae TaxID=4779 RepID=A0A976IJA4_BRELC|nr:hypothetical protein CCR75_007732 [Bremia lactucae]
MSVLHDEQALKLKCIGTSLVVSLEGAPTPRLLVRFLPSMLLPALQRSLAAIPASSVSVLLLQLVPVVQYPVPLAYRFPALFLPRSGRPLRSSFEIGPIDASAFSSSLHAVVN